MIIGTGSGRCGTKSLSRVIGGVHEPGYRRFWHLDPFIDYAKSKHISSSAQGYIGILGEDTTAVDVRFAPILPLIKEKFPDAKVIVLFRDPVYTIRSWFNWGIWTDNNPHGPAESRYTPSGGWLDTDSRHFKAAWYWNDLYRMILSAGLENTEFWKTNSLPITLNESKRELEDLSIEGVQEIKHYTDKTYNLLEEYSNSLPRPLFERFVQGA